jgi:hypothetical protein
LRILARISEIKRSLQGSVKILARIKKELDPRKDPFKKRSSQGSFQMKILARIVSNEDPRKDPFEKRSMEEP